MSNTNDSRLVLWQDVETVTELNFPPSIGRSGNLTLNEEGAVVVTQGASGSQYDTYIWIPTQPNGATGSVITAPVPPRFVVSDMNIRRDIVGVAYDFAANTSRAVRLRGGAQSAEDLNDLIPANSGWVLEKATGINDAGVITGTGFRTDSSGTSLEFAAFLLTPN